MSAVPLVFIDRDGTLTEEVGAVLHAVNAKLVSELKAAGAFLARRQP